MTPNRASCLAKCPYFIHACETSITCEGFIGPEIKSNFYKRKVDSDAQIRLYCSTDWESCPIAQMHRKIEKLYDKWDDLTNEIRRATK